MKNLNDALLVSIVLHPDNSGVLLVGRQNKKTGAVDIVNAFQGEEAMELYTKLTTNRSGRVKGGAGDE